MGKSQGQFDMIEVSHWWLCVPKLLTILNPCKTQVLLSRIEKKTFLFEIVVFLTVLLIRILMFLASESASGFVSYKYESGSGSFHHAKLVGKILISTVFWLLFDSLSLKNDVNVPVFWIRMFLSLPDPHPDALVRGTDPHSDPYQNVTDPQHWF